MSVSSTHGTTRELSSTLSAGGFDIPARLSLPLRGAPRAAILLIPGSLFSNVDGDFPAWNVFPHMYAHLARQLSERGLAVYRYAKAGPGTDTVIADVTEVERTKGSFLKRVHIARLALAAMRAELASQGIEPVPAIIAGHSEGAVVATLLARDEPGSVGVVLLAGPSVGILDIMREQQSQFVPPADREEALRIFDEALASIRRGDGLSAEQRASRFVGGLGQMDAAGLEYMRGCDAVDPAQAVSLVEQPMLIVQGTRDGSVSESHAHRLRAARGRGERDTDLVILSGLQHFFKRLPDGVGGVEAFGLPGDVDARVASAIDAWVQMLEG